MRNQSRKPAQRTRIVSQLRRVLLLGCGCLAMAACNGAKEHAGASGAAVESGAGSALVRVAPVRPVRKTLVRRTEQPGTIEAQEESPLHSKLAGYLAAVHVDIGDAITGPTFDAHGRMTAPGQVLAELAIPELDEEFRQKQSRVVMSQAAVRQAQAATRVAEAARGSARAKHDEATAAAERAAADFDRSKSEWARFRDLAEKGSVNRQVAEEKENLFRSAEAARKEAEARISSAKSAMAEAEALLEKSQADFDAATAALGVAEAERDRVAALLSYTKIHAPYDGVVTTRNVHTGHFVQPVAGGAAKPLFVVMRTQTVRVVVDVPEADAVWIKPGSEARIRVPSLASESFSGTVSRVGWRLNESTRTLRTEIDAQNPLGRLRPGMYAYADLKVAERPDALALPQTAVWPADGQSFCFTIDEQGKVLRTPVVTGIRAGDEVEILSGLSGGEAVIGFNPSAFREGQFVEKVESAAAR
jgi:RND family efflux transporter MFP subunit